MLMSPSRIAFIGSGNVAWHLAPLLDRMYYTVKEVYSPQQHHAARLSQRLYQATVRTSLDFSGSASHVFIIAVADDAIRAIMQDLVLPEGAFVLHTAGNKSLRILENPFTPHIGVFYPLQTFSCKREVSLADVPVLFEGNTKEVEQVIMGLAKAIGVTPRKVSFKERQWIHVAAVFASNFVNHMLTTSHDLLKKEKIDFDLLKPLILETVAKGISMEPHKAQTGPAVRHDTQVMDSHLQLLGQHEKLAELYQLISQDIMSRYALGEHAKDHF